MKTPYRRELPDSIANAALVAASSLVSTYYRGANPASVKALVNLASDIVDEIEARMPLDPMAKARAAKAAKAKEPVDGQPTEQEAA